MQFGFLGYGGAFDHDLGNSSVLVRLHGTAVLLDCGYTVYGRLKEAGLLEVPEYVLINHLHNDHCASLPTLIHHRELFGSQQKIKLVWQDEYMFGQLYKWLDVTLPQPEQYVDFVPAKELPWLTVIDTRNRHVEDYRSYACMVTEGEERLVYTSDLGDPDFIFQTLEEGQIAHATILHDVSYAPVSHHHASYADVQRHLEAWPDIIGFHHRPENRPADCRIASVAERPDLQWWK